MVIELAPHEGLVYRSAISPIFRCSRAVFCPYVKDIDLAITFLPLAFPEQASTTIDLSHCRIIEVTRGCKHFVFLI